MKLINQIFNHETDKAFNCMIHEYKNNGNYLERENLNNFINNEMKYLVRKTDDQMDNEEISN